MKKFNEWYENLSIEDVTWLMAIFLSAMLGTLTSGLVLKFGLDQFGDAGAMARFLVSLAATAVYAGVVGSIFYIMFPESRMALKEIFVKNKDRK